MFYKVALVCCVLCVLVSGCVHNGHGEQRDDQCVVIYCDEGHQLVNGTCVLCAKGFYSDAQDLEPCQPCPNLPRHSDAVRYGEVTPNCSFRCHPGTWSQNCSSLGSSLTPLAMLLTAVAGFVYFVRRVKEQKKSR